MLIALISDRLALVCRMPFSPELTALCQTQLNLLGQFGSSAQGVIYLAEAGQDERNWCPIAAYPHFPATEVISPQFLLPPEMTGLLEENRFRPNRDSLLLRSPQISAFSPGLCVLPEHDFDPGSAGESESPLLYQVVLPLQQERFMLGILVVSRADRDWQESEYWRLEQVAQTLTWARVMDRRLQWLQEQLQQQERDAERRQDILDMMVHQIRNPLTALKTFGKLLLRRFSVQDQNFPIAESIVKESDRLQFLVQQLQNQLSCPEVVGVDSAPADERPRLGQAAPEEMLPLRSLSSPSPPLTLPQGKPIIPVYLNEILAPLLSGAAAIAADRQLQFSQHLPPDGVVVEADASSLREVISNLLDNALKYTPAGGSVAVQGQAAAVPGWQWLIVSDTGPGIPPEDLPHLFQRHYRGVQAAGDIPGTGLGLALARDWMESMGGRLEVISPAGEWRPFSAEPGGVGSAFRLWLRENI